VAAVLRAFDDGRARSEFYRGWRAGVHAGLTHPAILAHLDAGTGTTRALRDHLLSGTREGRDLDRLLRAVPHLVEPFELALLRMGEESGQLEPVLGALADFHQRQHRLILKVRQWLSYPIFVSLVAVLILPLPLVFAGRTGAYLAAAGLGLLLWATAGGSVFAGLAQRYQRRPPFVRARFARTLAMTIGAGLPLGRAVMLAAEASGDPKLLAHLRRVGERQIIVQPLTTTLAGQPILTPELRSALIVADKSGDFASSLGRLADLYEDGFR
jgi:type II secretory pathway component PulF